MKIETDILSATSKCRTKRKSRKNSAELMLKRIFNRYEFCESEIRNNNENQEKIGLYKLQNSCEKYFLRNNVVINCKGQHWNKNFENN